MMLENVQVIKQEVAVDLNKTDIIECPLISQMKSEETSSAEVARTSHKPDHEKAEMLEWQGRGYETLWRATGKKCYKDSMDACFADAKDYRSCGFVRPLGATV
jgi:hypothetical protein